jgi:apolipoprotein N-acyltransferase
VQGNIDQYRKWNEAYENDILDAYSRLTARAAEEPTDLVVWPETAVPGWIPNEIKFTRWLEDTARSAGAFLLAGAATHQQQGDYNAAFLFTPQGHILAQYRKQHLVPFGEFVPLQPVLSRFISVLNELGDFHGSDDKTVFQLPEVRFSVNICFEDLFPGLVRDFVRRGAQLTVNITNDGWYLDTAAPEQHFTANVLRAVETRTWVVRAANTGVSGFIDPKGRVVARTRLQEEAVLRGAPSPMAGETFYVRRGDIFAWACALAAMVGALLSLRRKFLI